MAAAPPPACEAPPTPKGGTLTAADSVTIRFAREADLSGLRKLIPHAFSAHFGRNIDSDASFAARFYLPNCKVWVAESGADLLGCMYLTIWGTFAWFGPLCVDPAAWGRGIGSKLIAATVAECKRLALPALSLFTMPESPKHIHLYTKFALMPRYVHNTGAVSFHTASPA